MFQCWPIENVGFDEGPGRKKDQGNYQSSCGLISDQSFIPLWVSPLGS